MPELLIIKSNVLVRLLNQIVKIKKFKRNFKLESYFKVEVNKPEDSFKGNLKSIIVFDFNRP